MKIETACTHFRSRLARVPFANHLTSPLRRHRRHVNRVRNCTEERRGPQTGSVLVPRFRERDPLTFSHGAAKRNAKFVRDEETFSYSRFYCALWI